MQKYKKNIIYIIIISFVVLYFSLKDDFSSVIDQLLHINIWWLLFACLLFVISWVFKTVSLLIFARQFKKRYKFKKMFNLILITEFFNGVTPFATGGQPAQVYMLKRDGVETPVGTTIVVQNFITYQIALVLFGICAIFLNSLFGIFLKVIFLRKLVIIGFAINILVISVTCLVGFGNKFNKVITRKIITLLTKVKIIKDKEKTIKKWDKNLDKFHQSALELRNNKEVFIKGVVYNFISLSFIYIIPLVILFSIGDYASLTVLSALVSSAYVFLIVSFVPVPGAAGGVEFGFISFFGTFIVGYKLTAVMLVWRFITYYFGLFVGAITLLFYNEKEKEK